MMMKYSTNKLYGKLPQLQIGLQLSINHGSICKIGHDSKGYYLEKVGLCRDQHFMNFLRKKIEEKLDRAI
jgi:hypothetical protein